MYFTITNPGSPELNDSVSITSLSLYQVISKWAILRWAILTFTHQFHQFHFLHAIAHIEVRAYALSKTSLPLMLFVICHLLLLFLIWSFYNMRYVICSNCLYCFSDLMFTSGTMYFFLLFLRYFFCSPRVQEFLSTISKIFSLFTSGTSISFYCL